MSSQLEQLLGYLEREGVTEVLFGSGRPIAMRKAGAVANITARPLSADQLANMLRGTEIATLIPDTDGEGPTGEIVVGRRRATAQVARRGHEIVISLKRSESAPEVTPGTQPMARVAVATPSVALPIPTEPPRAKSPTSGRAKSSTSAPRAKTPTSSPRTKGKTAAPRTKSATAAPRKKSPTAMPTHGIAPPAPSAQPMGTLDFSLDDGIELGAPLGTFEPVPAAYSPPDNGGISLGSLDGGADFELDLSPPVGVQGRATAPAAPPPPQAGFDIDLATSPPASFEVDFSTSPPQAFAPPPSRDGGFAKANTHSFAKPTTESFAKPTTHSFAKPTIESFAKPTSGSFPKPPPPMANAPTQLSRAPVAQAVPSTPIASSGSAGARSGAGGAAESIASSGSAGARSGGESIELAGTQPISRFTNDSPVISAGAPLASSHPVFESFVHTARERGASDLHISAARVTSIRVHGELVPMEAGAQPLSKQAAEELLLPLLDADYRAQLEKVGYVDLALEAPDGGRLRANISRQQQGLKGTFRLALAAPATLEQLGLPADLAKVVGHHQGLVVIAGPSGHGKTTTMAALVDLLNSSKPYHILAIEDPVEIVHPRKQAVISQREAGRHTVSFARGLKASLREDPDVIVIGELRDRESVEIALTAAETGHLVIATMSTPSAAKTIDRLIDMFPPEDHSQVRASIAGALRAIVAQRLLPKRGGGIVPAIELVTGVLPLAVLIRDDKLYQLPNLMQRGRAFGMIRFDESLAEHVRAGRLDEETALDAAESRKDLQAALRPAAAAAATAPQAKTTAIWGFGKKGDR